MTGGISIAHEYEENQAASSLVFFMAEENSCTGGAFFAVAALSLMP
ncbi:hypothetical protein L248_2097 [Schleiferilactobacillus shenzhenensis LY-73]|uniref:Uncharacterized protein n=1 Tax=Schleiferilactobacillus shenzhenensis LY-73 TaxID=1231336 RepID=U4TPQ8_9LACO|nr:hypothetical protein L248_2097 [Schleiferilactobacillus shenzhenensis LY-73]